MEEDGNKKKGGGEPKKERKKERKCGFPLFFRRRCPPRFVSRT